MYVRLAFSVAAHLEADILLMDEVLAVGDAVFQRKCLGKMEDAARTGRTVVFVSHNMVAVQSLCTRAVMLEDGRVRADGPVGEVVSEYLDSGLSDMATSRVWQSAEDAPGTAMLRIVEMRACSESSTAGNVITMDTPVRIEFEYHRLTSGPSFDIEVHLINHEDVVVLYTSPGGCPDEPGAYKSFVTIPGHFLNSGVYRAKLMLIEEATRWSWLEGASISFSVEDLTAREIGWMTRRPGVVHVPLRWQTEHAGSALTAATK
jgi:lipopolysaccharide transport system ATP-binding protein